MKLNRLTGMERHIINLLRLYSVDEDTRTAKDRQLISATPEGLRAAFDALGRAANQSSLKIFEANAFFASDDELAVLSRINAYQRPSVSEGWAVANPLQRAMKTCADALLRGRRRLIPHPALIATYLARGGVFRIEYCANFTTTRGDGAEWGSRAERMNKRLDNCKAKALALVRDKDIVEAAEFYAVGISSQDLSRLCRWGFVDRVGHARYRASKLVRQSHPERFVPSRGPRHAPLRVEAHGRC